MSHLRYLCHLLFPIFSVSDPILVSSSDDDSEDENPPPPTHLPLVGSIEHELALTPCFLDGSIQHEKQLVILLMILHINVIHIHSSSEPPLFWLKF
jgi:hypothetical protein